MSKRNLHPVGSEILGRTAGCPARDVGQAEIETWKRRLGYVTMFAGVSALFASQPSEAAAEKKGAAVAPGVAQRANEIVKQLNAKCSKPELLRRQSEYRLPSQAGEFNMLEVLAGTDNCPGTPIPAGTYTTGTPFTDTGNTTGANSTVSFVQANCIVAPQGQFYEQVIGPDHIYSFTLTARGANPQIRVTPTAPYDTSIYILSATGTGCPAGTGNDVTNCVTGRDTALAGSAETITAAQMNNLPLNTPLYLFIDSFYSTTGSNPAGSSGAYTVQFQDVTIAGAVTPPANDAPVDINGDGRTDYVTVRSAGGPSGVITWWTMFQDGFPANTTSRPTSTTEWGLTSDTFVPADYDGDGKDDFAVWRPGNPGAFYIVRSSDATLFYEPFGVNGDDPTVVGDYTGDNRDDLAVYRAGATPGNASSWFYRSIGSPPGVQEVQWGQGGDTPAPGDYDGDGKYDFVVQRTDTNGINGRFWVREADGTQYSETFGLSTDSVVPGDYDDDGKTDFAVVRNDNGVLRWDFEPSGTAGTTVVSDTWGVSSTDEIVQGDYNGDGRTDYAVWRPGNPSYFMVMTVGDRVISIQPWGLPDDYPVANYNVH